MKILCIGEMLIDFTPVTGMVNMYTANPGGAPANVAVSAARNGVNAGFLGKLGNDDFGRLLVETLKADNVEILVPELTDMATTTLAFVTLDANGDRSFTFARKPGADMLLNSEDVGAVDFSEWDIVHAGSVSQAGLAGGDGPCEGDGGKMSQGTYLLTQNTPERDAVLLALKKAKEANKLVSFDINYRDKIWGVEECKAEVMKALPYVDLLKISDEELVFVGGEDNIPAFMKDQGITVLVVTLGGEGARIYFDAGDAPAENGSDGDWNRVGSSDVYAADIPSMKVKVVDTTGAGDAYWGGFLSSLLRQGVRAVGDITMEKLITAGRYGAVSGGLCVQKNGGIPALPTLAEIEEKMNGKING